MDQDQIVAPVETSAPEKESLINSQDKTTKKMEKTASKKTASKKTAAKKGTKAAPKKAGEKKATPAKKGATAKKGAAPKNGEATPSKKGAVTTGKPRGGKIAEIIALHLKGLTNKQIVEKGYNPNTVSINVASYKKTGHSTTAGV